MGWHPALALQARIITTASYLQSTDDATTACQGTALHNPFRGFSAVDSIAPGLSSKENVFMYLQFVLLRQ